MATVIPMQWSCTNGQLELTNGVGGMSCRAARFLILRRYENYFHIHNNVAPRKHICSFANIVSSDVSLRQNSCTKETFIP